MTKIKMLYGFDGPMHEIYVDLDMLLCEAEIMSIEVLPFTIVNLPERNYDMKQLGHELQPGEQLYFLYDYGHRQAVHVFAMKPDEAKRSNETTLKYVPAKWLSDQELKEEQVAHRFAQLLINHGGN